ncbi:hypothetical protein ACHAXT_007193 [Thalassiosira profunda]
MLRLSPAAAALLLAAVAAAASPSAVAAFSPGAPRAAVSSIVRRPQTRTTPTSRRHPSVFATDPTSEDGDDEDAPPENPYADPNYPDLEFVNYDDPEYAVDQGLGDSEIYDNDDSKTLAEIEAMREERRRKNDEFQFETYHANVLRGGERSLGEWTVFQTDTFMGPEIIQGRNPEAADVPRLLKWDKVLKVVSRGSKIVTDPDAAWRVDGERIVHEERLATVDDFPTLMLKDEGEDDLEWEEEDVGHVENAFWPNEMGSLDFRGPGGNMCVGKAYTICDARPLRDGGEDGHEGPFSEMRTEVGVQENGMRFRVKLDYALLDEDSDTDGSDAAPPLHLRTLTVCRETLDGYWPDPSDNEDTKEGEEGPEKEGKSEVRRRNQQDITAALFGPPGASGGLYDPPPVGSEERAVGNYMLLDFEGGATVLLPHRFDQDAEDEDDRLGGWVTSLDWAPGKIRYQVDRKVMGGTKLKGLRALELSEVQSADADKWRPKDGGADMRQ